MSDEDDKNDMLSKLKQAALEGRVVLPQDFSNLIVDDGEARLLAGIEPDTSPPLITLTITNAGGFSGVYLSHEDWVRMKKTVDEMFEGKTN